MPSIAKAYDSSAFKIKNEVGPLPIKRPTLFFVHPYLGLALRLLSLRWLMSALREENAILTPAALGEKLM